LLLLNPTGPLLVDGSELAEAASKALGMEIEYEAISEAEAKTVLKAQAREHDDSEKQYILEYYALVREGKTNYISTTAFHDATGTHPMEPDQFFKVYKEEFRGENGTPNKKRKVRD
jgi:hypothetical protein